jgi:regulator of sigma E protease
MMMWIGLLMSMDWLALAMPLADFAVTAPLAETEPGFISTLLTSIGVWGRVALGIGLVIFVHELGHFVAAKTFGVKCEKFYVGFDVPMPKIGPIQIPSTLGKFTYGETEYGIGIIPLGGYVKMLGQDDDPRKMEEENERIRQENEHGDEEATPELDPRSFPAKPVWQRMIIISAGVVVNVITGILFAAIAYGYGVQYSPAIVGGVTPGGPAWQAGVEPGGRVVSVGDWSDEDMHFREMRMEILTQGLDAPETPIGLAVKYENEVRNFKLKGQSRPEQKEAKMIGLAIPNSTTLDSVSAGDPNTVAATAFGEADRGATIVGFDGNAINEDAMVPGTPLFHYINSNPRKTIALDLRRTDGSTHTVELPPQQAKSIGVRFSVGPVVALVENGPAAKAGMQVGDVITKMGDDVAPDAFDLALDLVDAKEPVSVTVRRGSDEDAKEFELQIKPTESLQTLSPTESISGEIAINSVGFAYEPLPVISELVVDALTDEEKADDDLESLKPGDRLTEVKLVLTDENKDAEWLQSPGYEQVYAKLKEGWEFSPITPLVIFRKTVQSLPEGTRLRVAATRPPEDRIVSSIVVVGKDSDDQVMFSRGIATNPSEAIQQATSFPGALALGWKEGKRRFWDVVKFLKMISGGRVSLKHVGGPLEIARIAKQETERGISPQLMFLTMLSMNLAILNFLPIPALDGGHMVFLLYELVAGKRANEQLEFRLTVAGLLALLTLMVVVFANDIIRHL